jgi:CRISPR-associated protein (TIGR02584 family)
MTTTLLAVTGLSPAIVTETLWALAHGKPSLLPQRVVFLTTATGAVKIEEQLFTPIPEWDGRTVWETLRAALKAAPDELIAAPCQIIPMSDGTSGRAIHLDDIRTPAENNAAAEFIFGQVWNVVRDPAQHLIASIAGGRKTMGVLLHSAVSLIGRENDRVTHVLVDAPYDTLPGFFFPGQPGQPLVSCFDARAFDPADARLHLADVPFVPLRNRFKQLDDLPGSFLTLRDELTARLRHDAGRPAVIHISHRQQLLSIDGATFRCGPRPLAVLEFILRCDEKRQTFEGDGKTAPYQLAAESFVKWRMRHKTRLQSAVFRRDFTARELTKDLNHLRTILRTARWQPATNGFVQPPFLLEVAE